MDDQLSVGRVSPIANNSHPPTKQEDGLLAKVSPGCPHDGSSAAVINFADDSMNNNTSNISGSVNFHPSRDSKQAAIQRAINQHPSTDSEDSHINNDANEEDEHDNEYDGFAPPAFPGGRTASLGKRKRTLLAVRDGVFSNDDDNVKVEVNMDALAEEDSSEDEVLGTPGRHPQIVHRIKGGGGSSSGSEEGNQAGKAYSDALLLASLSSDIESPVKKNTEYADDDDIQVNEQGAPKTPLCLKPPSCTADTPRRSNVNPSNLNSTERIKPFTLHPKSSSEFPNKRGKYGETQQPSAADSSSGKEKRASPQVTPDYRNQKSSATDSRNPKIAVKMEGERDGVGHGASYDPAGGMPYPSHPGQYPRPQPHHAAPYGYPGYPYGPPSGPPSFYPRPYPPPHGMPPRYMPHQQHQPGSHYPHPPRPPTDQEHGLSPTPLHPLSAPKNTVPTEEDGRSRYYQRGEHRPEGPTSYDPRYGPPPPNRELQRVPTFSVSIDENSPRMTGYDLSSPAGHPSLATAPAGAPEYPNVNTPPRVYHHRSYPPPPPSQGEEYYRDQTAPYPHLHHPHHPPAVAIHRPPPNTHDPYEPHPHDMLFRRAGYSTPPPNDEGGWDASQDIIPAVVSHERYTSPGGRVHQFHKGARTIHSEPIILRKKFSWRNYPELEEFLIKNRNDYLRHSALNYTSEQKHFNNSLTEGLLELAARHNYVFDESCFNFVAVRDRIRCYYKSYVQSSKKRGVIVGFTKVTNGASNNVESMDELSSGGD